MPRPIPSPCAPHTLRTALITPAAAYEGGIPVAIIDRAKNIIMQPRQEWQVIDGEQTSAGQLYSSYIIPLSAIPVIAGLIGMSVFGISIPFVGRIRVPIGTGVGNAIVRYVLGLIAVYVLALIIDALAPSFNGGKNQLQALKLSAYAYTAAWLAGILTVIPALSIIAALLSLYSLYLLYTGLPVLMKSPQEKALGYTVVVVIAAIVLFIIVGFVASAIFGVGVAGRFPR
jgi:hypothetical protein